MRGFGPAVCSKGGTFPGSGSTGSGGTFGSFSSATPPPASNLPATPATPAEQNALNQATQNGGSAVAVAGEPVTPGGSGLTEAAFRHDVPGPLLALIILLGLGALAMTVSGARARGMRAPASASRVFDRVFPRRA